MTGWILALIFYVFGWMLVMETASGPEGKKFRLRTNLVILAIWWWPVLQHTFDHLINSRR